MKRAVNFLMLIAMQSQSILPAFAQGGAPYPEIAPSPESSVSVIAVVLVFLVLGLGAVAVMLFIRKSADNSPRDETARPLKPREQDAPQPARAETQARDATFPSVGSVFISYRRQDSADITGRIYDRLVERIGNEAVYKDVDSIPLGVDFRKHLQNSVSRCSVLLAVIGKNWLESHGERGKRNLDEPRDYLRIEIETALQRDIPVIPVLVQGAMMPHEEDLPPSLQPLAYRNAVAVRPDPDFRADIERLINGIQSHLGLNR
jgi:hypothetical protein